MENETRTQRILRLPERLDLLLRKESFDTRIPINQIIIDRLNASYAKDMERDAKAALSGSVTKLKRKGEKKKCLPMNILQSKS